MTLCHFYIKIIPITQIQRILKILIDNIFKHLLFSADAVRSSVFYSNFTYLEVIRNLKKRPKFYQASSSEMFGEVLEIPQTEKTAFNPQSPYAISKLFSHFITKNYREAYNIYTSSGICFNHESPLRGEEFVTRKITRCLSKIQSGEISHFELGNISARRDWGFAGDYVEGMWRTYKLKNQMILFFLLEEIIVSKIL